MGKISVEFYKIYLIGITIWLMIPFTFHLQFLYEDEKWDYSTTAIILYYIATCLLSTVLSNIKLLQTAEWFVRHRFMLAGAMIALNILMIVNSVIRLVGLWENIVITCILAIVLLYIPVSIFLHFNSIGVELEFSHLKSTKLSQKQWLLLFGFHTVLAVSYTTLYLFDESSLGKKELIENFQTVRYVCQYINIFSIPMSYQAILTWNSEQLRFKGKYPNTSSEWKGLMKRNPDGTWEVYQSPEDHNVFIV